MIDFREVTGVALAGGTKRNPNNMIEFDYSKKYPYGGGFLTDGLTQYGITFNIMEDGSIIMNGTSTTEFWISFGKRTPVTTGATYSFSSNCPDAARYLIDMVIVGYDVDGNKTKTVNNYVSSIYTVPEGTVSVDWRIHIWRGVTLNNVVFRLMFNEGETLNDYYLPITAWSDVENVYWTKRSPANIIPLPYSLLNSYGTLNYKPETETKYNVTATYRKDGSISFSGTNTHKSNAAQFYTSEFIIPRSGTYKIGKKGTGNYSKMSIMIQVLKKDNTWVSNIGNTSSSTTFTVPQEYVDKGYKFRITPYANAGINVDNTVLYPILTHISGTTMPYYANKRNPKNLIDVSTYYSNNTTQKNGFDYTVFPDGHLHVSGTMTEASGANNSTLTWRFTKALEVGKTYTLSLNASCYKDKTNSIGDISSHMAIMKGGSWVKNIGSDSGNSFTFTVTEDMITEEGQYFRGNIWIYDNTKNSSYDFICYPILNEGETAEPFYIE